MTLVRLARGAPRRTAAQQSSFQQYSFPGPSGGWVSNHNLASGELGSAHQLDNFFPTPTGAVLRRGCLKHAEPGDPVFSLFTYVQGNTAQMFAATNEDIWNVTAGDEAEAVYSISASTLSTANYVSTDGILFVRGCNGADVPWLYDGSAFSTTPALTFDEGETTTPENLSFVWVFKDRFWFIRKETLDAYYLPVGQLGGELVKFSLGGVFKQGGGLVYGGEWSQESGDGLSAMCVFITDNGEAAVYQGSDPGNANDWARVGTYTIGKPLGPNAVVQRGGDLVICTDVGFISLSQALLRDTAELSPTAMSRPIEPDWSFYAAERFERRWAAMAWTEEQMLVVAPPTISGTSPVWLVANAITGKWGRFTGWNANCLAVFQGKLYFGSPDGNVYQANVTGADAGKPYTGVYLPLFDQMGVQGCKTVGMGRAVMRSRFDVQERLSAHTDFTVTLPPPPSAASGEGAAVWGAAVWGESKWADPAAGKRLQSRWRNLFGAGEAVSIGHQVTSASVSPQDTEIIRTDVMFTAGDLQS